MKDWHMQNKFAFAGLVVVGVLTNGSRGGHGRGVRPTCCLCHIPSSSWLLRYIHPRVWELLHRGLIERRSHYHYMNTIHVWLA